MIRFTRLEEQDDIFINPAQVIAVANISMVKREDKHSPAKELPLATTLICGDGGVRIRVKGTVKNVADKLTLHKI